MKQIRICLEIQGLAEDEYGRPCPAGLCITFGEVEEEKYIEKYSGFWELINSLNMEDVLEMVHLNKIISVDNCRIITPEEYDQEYGDAPGLEGEQP